MYFALAFILTIGAACAQGPAGPIWTPPGGTAGNTACSGVSGPSGESPPRPVARYELPKLRHSCRSTYLSFNAPFRMLTPPSFACGLHFVYPFAYPTRHSRSAASNVSAVFSLGSGAGQPWAAANSVAVAPYGQITFFVNTPGVFPVLVSINAAGGTMNFRHDICATYFTSPTVPCMCGTVVTGSTVPAPSPVTDALRVFVGAGAWRVACWRTGDAVSLITRHNRPHPCPPPFIPAGHYAQFSEPYQMRAP